MTTCSLHTADALARTLAKRNVDPNEAAKCFAHLRDVLQAAGSDEHQQQAAVERWWSWLDAVSGPAARTVVRSRQTRGYYEDLLDACQLHLGTLSPPEVLPTLGWAIRLMRYYRNVPHASAQPTSFPPPPPQPRPTPDPKRPPAPGARFTNVRVLEVSQAGLFVDLRLPDDLDAIGAIRAADTGGKRYGPGHQLNVEVIEVRPRKQGGIIVYLRPVSGKGKDAGG
ncbi:MAG TPA: hypothetical protein VFZ66_13060 [Herpetosiphonaceae bacterium]